MGPRSDEARCALLGRDQRDRRKVCAIPNHIARQELEPLDCGPGADEEIRQGSRPDASGLTVPRMDLPRKKQGGPRYGPQRQPHAVDGSLQILEAVEAVGQFGEHHIVDDQRLA